MLRVIGVSGEMPAACKLTLIELDLDPVIVFQVVHDILQRRLHEFDDRWL